LNTKRLVSLLIATVILTTICVSAPIYSETYEKYKCYSLDSLGLLVEIETSALAWPEENINITIRAEATQANIHIHYIQVNIFSLKESRDETLLNNTAFLEDAHLNLGEFNETSYEVLIPKDTLPGLLYGEVDYSWSIEGDPSVFDKLKAFAATYIQNKPYEELRQDYEALNSFCNDLQTNHTALEANYTELQQKYQQLEGQQIGENNSTGLMYIFIITTGIFVASTILLMIRRPKTTTW